MPGLASHPPAGHLSSLLSQLAFRFEYEPLQSSPAMMERNDFGVLFTSSLIPFCNQLQFRSAPAAARAILTIGERPRSISR